jgi:protein-S-isoprenylcysteine O-methyltransferase Ste14
MKHFLAHGIIYSAFLFAGVSMAALCVFIISGSFQLVDLGFNETGILIFDTGLSLLFFIQHSGMMRKTFQKKAQRIIPEAYYLAVYAIVSGVTLIFLLAFWQKSDWLIYSAKGPAQWGILLLFFTAGIGFMWGAGALGEFDPLGVKNIKNHLRAKPPRVNPFIVKGPYRLVRHPLYLFVILMIWLCPDLTADRFLFNVLWTVWIVIGAILEERDLVDFFGNDYRKYQETVPMLLPDRKSLDRLILSIRNRET